MIREDIQRLNNCLLSRGVNWSIYDYNDMSLQDLLCTFFKHINMCIDDVNTYSKMVLGLYDWVTGEGMKTTVNNKLEEMAQDGTLADIINEQIFEDLNGKVTEVESGLETLRQEVADDMDNFKVDIEKKIQTLATELKNEIQNKLNETINNFTQEFEGLKGSVDGVFDIKAVNKYGLKNGADLFPILTKYLKDAKAGTTSNMIYIPEGEYTVSKSIEELSNVHIIFDPKAIIRKGDTWAGIFQNGKLDAEYNGRSAGSNIILEGGIWYGGNYSMGFALGENIIIRNATFYGVKGSHVMEFSGCKNVIVENCRFIGQTIPNYDERPEAEAIQISTQTVAGYPFFGHNAGAINTTCEQITIRNCYFENFTTGVGSHGAVYGYWDTDITINNNIFNNMSNIGVRPFAMDCINIKDNKFIDCKTGVLCDGIVQNSSLNRPTSQSCQDIEISNNSFLGTRKDFDTCIYVKGAKRTPDEGGYSNSNDVRIRDNKITIHNGYAIRTNFCEHVIISGNNGFAGTCIRISYTHDCIITSNSMEAQDGYWLIVSRDAGYFESGNACTYTTVSNNSIQKTNGRAVNISYAFNVDFTNNTCVIRGDSDSRQVLDINSDSAKVWVANNSDYYSSAINRPAYYSSPATRDVKFSSNISKGYANSVHTQCDSTGVKGIFTPVFS